MADALDDLMQALDTVIRLLEQLEEDRWAEWMKRSRQELRSHDAHGLERILQAYGGAGSFNEIGYPAEEPTRRQVAAVATQIYHLASQLHRECAQPD